MTDAGVVPAISTAVAGPLGVLHLPRLWLKNLLFARGRLAAGYKHTTGTFDRMRLDALGLDAEALEAYFAREQPDYLHFEAWVREHALHLEPAVIADLNARYIAAQMSAGAAEIRRGELGIDDPALRRGILLNDLDDWSALHRSIPATVIPSVSRDSHVRGDGSTRSP